MIIRPIIKNDDQSVTQLIRQSLRAYDLDKPGTAYSDPHLDHLTSYYEKIEKSGFFVIEERDEIIG